MQKKVILLSIIAFWLSCNSGETNDINQNELNNITSAVDSTLFTLEGKNFTAILKRVSNDYTGKANGATTWQRTGRLSSILTELYGEPVDLLNNPYFRYNYTLNIDWGKQTSFEVVRQKVAGKLKNEFGYIVKTERRIQPLYILSIKKPSVLAKAKETDFAIEGATSKVVLEKGKWKIYASLKKLTEILSKQTNQTIVLKKDFGSMVYYFELTASRSFDTLVSQLEQNYGLVIQEKKVPVEYYIIDFYSNSSA